RHGSGWSVTRLMRTRGACASRVTASVAACCALGAIRLKVAGSDRREAVRDPPRTGPAGDAVVEPDGGGALHAAASTRTPIVAVLRRCRATLEPTGQLLDRRPVPGFPCFPRARP